MTYKTKNNLILDLFDTIKCTTEYLIDMQKQYNESHEDEIHALKSILKRCKAEFKRLDKVEKSQNKEVLEVLNDSFETIDDYTDVHSALALSGLLAPLETIITKLKTTN